MWQVPARAQGIVKPKIMVVGTLRVPYSWQEHTKFHAKILQRFVFDPKGRAQSPSALPIQAHNIPIF
jgi:hypothetical protein